MNSINQEKEINQNLDIAKSKLYFDFVKQRRERFEFAEIAHFLASEKNIEDMLIINNALNDWYVKSKIPEQKKELLSHIQSMFRIQSYCNQLETISKESVSRYITTEKRNNELSSENRRLGLNIIQVESEYLEKLKVLQNEIEFLQSPH